MDVGRDIELLDALDMHDCFSAIKVTDKRRTWLKGARAGDRWAVTLTEGGGFSYGQSLRDAIGRALRVGNDTDTTQDRGDQGFG